MIRISFIFILLLSHLILDHAYASRPTGIDDYPDDYLQVDVHVKRSLNEPSLIFSDLTLDENVSCSDVELPDGNIVSAPLIAQTNCHNIRELADLFQEKRGQVCVITWPQSKYIEYSQDIFSLKIIKLHNCSTPNDPSCPYPDDSWINKTPGFAAIAAFFLSSTLQQNDSLLLEEVSYTEQFRQVALSKDSGEIDFHEPLDILDELSSLELQDLNKKLKFYDKCFSKDDNV